MVEPGIPCQPCAESSQVRVDPDVPEERKVAGIIWPDRKQRTSCEKSRAHKKFPPKPAQKLPNVPLASLLKR